MHSVSHRILILEDAEEIARGYETILNREGDGYDIAVCFAGEDVMKLIDSKQKFDLAIMDIMLPPEDLETYTLEDSYSTGVRLIEGMIKEETCRRFYVITVRGDLKERIEDICRGSSVLKFESKLEHEPQHFLESVRYLLAKPVRSWAEGVAAEFERHVRNIEEYNPSVDSLTTSHEASLVVSLTWIAEALEQSEFRLDNGTKESRRLLLEGLMNILQTRYADLASSRLNEAAAVAAISINQFLNWRRGRSGEHCH